MTPAAYLDWVRAETSASADFSGDLDGLDAERLLVVGDKAGALLRHVAWLWCCGVQDARTYSLLFPVWVGAGNLECFDFLREKLEDGAAWVFVDAVDREPGFVGELATRYPRCRFLVAGGASAAGLLQSLFTCRSL